MTTTVVVFDRGGRSYGNIAPRTMIQSRSNDNDVHDGADTGGSAVLSHYENTYRRRCHLPPPQASNTARLDRSATNQRS